MKRVHSPKILCVVFLLVLAACEPTAPPSDSVFGTFTYTDSEIGSSDFQRPIVGALVKVWRAGALVHTTETNFDGRFNFTATHMPDGTDTTVQVFASNQAAHVLGAVGPFFVNITMPSSGNAPLDFSQNFGASDEVRSFNAAHDIRLASEYAQRHRDPGEREVIPFVDVTFMDHDGAGTRYNPPAGGLLIHHSHDLTDLVIMHEYAHFLEDKIGGFLLVPTIHDGCRSEQIPPNLVNSPENAWMEGFANYFAMAVKRANPSERFNLISGGTMTEAQLESPPSCTIVGTRAFDGRMITGDMIEQNVASALWALSDGGSKDRTLFQIFDKEIDGTDRHVLPNISLLCEAWKSGDRLPSDRARMEGVLSVNVFVSNAAGCRS